MKRLVCRPWLLRPPVERSPTVRLFSGRLLDSSTKSYAVWKRRPAGVGLNFLTGIAVSLHSLEELELLARGQAHVRLLPVLALSEEPAHALPLPLAVGDADVGDLHPEELFDGPPDLDLVGPAIHLEADRVGRFLQFRGLLGEQRAADELQRFHVPIPTQGSRRPATGRPARRPPSRGSSRHRR